MRECQGSRLAHCYEEGWLDALWRCPGYDDELAAEIFSANKLLHVCLQEIFRRTEKELNINEIHSIFLPLSVTFIKTN